MATPNRHYQPTRGTHALRGPNGLAGSIPPHATPSSPATIRLTPAVQDTNPLEPRGGWHTIPVTAMNHLAHPHDRLIVDGMMTEAINTGWATGISPEWEEAERVHATGSPNADDAYVGAVTRDAVSASLVDNGLDPAGGPVVYLTEARSHDSSNSQDAGGVTADSNVARFGNRISASTLALAQELSDDGFDVVILLVAAVVDSPGGYSPEARVARLATPSEVHVLVRGVAIYGWLSFDDVLRFGSFGRWKDSRYVPDSAANCGLVVDWDHVRPLGSLAVAV